MIDVIRMKLAVKLYGLAYRVMPYPYKPLFGETLDDFVLKFKQAFAPESEG